MSTYMGCEVGDFTYTGTPKKVKEYFVTFLGKKKAGELMKAMRNRKWIIISGQHGPTGKTTIADILRAIGYTYVIEEYWAKTIQISEPLTELREMSDIFESLGISRKC